ncbi:Gfo/Idh/MocA family protein [Microbacterium rhizosphaerae]|uniref:Gfo/Idh/MocA family oxidoreductase n=1 Tax=Microbacterium rhizosphaerae TaxID=1678237 RepID=A0ABZ0SK95_9MICO|nr:Gfo/Idh/MocA family oxidoreductase [Microbacterium rhizosphaerae]WPR89319.1 Gfo/Idh/MocA family oxidoreductase [Microbacterium rhizosphaerae]
MTTPVGIVGFGIRALMAEELAQTPDVEIRAICDPSPTARDRARAQFPDAFVTDSLDDLIGSGIAAVFVLAPDDTHAAITIACLEAGLAVFCEKPMAICIEDADAMLETARRTGSRLYVGHNMRHMAFTRAMRDIIRSGRIGEVKSIWVRHFVGNGGDYYFKDWHAERRHSTSLLLQKGAHDIDIIHWLADGYTERVAGMGGLTVYGDHGERGTPDGEMMTDWISESNWPPSTMTGINPRVDVEDLSLVTMQLDNGVLATYQQCHYSPDYWRNYTVIGTRGRLENVGDTVDAVINVWTTRRGGYAAPDEVVRVPNEVGSHGGADPKLIGEFLRFVRHGGTTETSPIAARQAIATGVLATDSMRSDQGGRTVPPLTAGVVEYFDLGQPGSTTPVLARAEPALSEG